MTTHAHPTVVPLPGPPVAVPSHRHNGAPQPTPGHDHQWILSAIFAVDAEQVAACAAAWMSGATPPGLPMAYDNLINVCGPICLKCNQPLSPATAALPCPVVLVPVLGVARG